MPVKGNDFGFGTGESHGKIAAMPDDWEQIRRLQHVKPFPVSPLTVGISLWSIAGAGLIFLNNRLALLDVRPAYLIACFMPIFFAGIGVLIHAWVIHHRTLTRTERF